MKRLITVLLLVALFPLQACGMQYSAEAIEARVVDAETNQPLEGVIVVAHWQLYGGMHPDNAGELTILETVTDKAGSFHFPAWGPKPLPSGAPSNARLTYLDPEILIYKSGYKHLRIANELTTDSLKNQGPALRRSQWNGKTVKLKQFAGSLEEYAKHFSNLNISLGFAYDSENCEWKLVPRMLAALLKEEASFTEKRIYNSLQRISVFSGPKEQKKCGSAKDFFREYLK